MNISERDFIEWSTLTGKGYRSNGKLLGTSPGGLRDMLLAQTGMKGYGTYVTLDDVIIAHSQDKEVLVHATFDLSLADAQDHWLIVEDIDINNVTLGDPWYGLSVRLT